MYGGEHRQKFDIAVTGMVFVMALVVPIVADKMTSEEATVIGQWIFWIVAGFCGFNTGAKAAKRIGIGKEPKEGGEE